MREGTAEVPHPIAAAHLPEAVSVFDAATALAPARDRVDPQPTLVELLVRHVLLPRALLPQIEINSIAHEEGTLASRLKRLEEAKAQLEGMIAQMIA
jgi:hypothetical protein